MRRSRTLPLALTLLCVAGAAHAATGNAYQTTWSALSPGNDWAAQVLRSLFPISNTPGLPGIGAAATVIGKMVGQLTGYIMAIAVVFVTYSTILQIHRAAETGRVLSSTTSSWTPVRLVLALAMMFPLPFGFSSGQAAVMQVAMRGIGMGRAVYTSATHHPSVFPRSVEGWSLRVMQGFRLFSGAGSTGGWNEWDRRLGGRDQG